MSKDELTDFEKRRKLIEGIIFSPDDFVEKVYSDYGKSLLSSAGGALGAAAGVAVAVTIAITIAIPLSMAIPIPI